MTPRTPVPPFTRKTAMEKVRAAEDVWNARDPAWEPSAYAKDIRWRSRDAFLSGREAIAAFVARRRAQEFEYRLIKELWAFTGDRLAVRFVSEWREADGQWLRSHGNENWLFDADGYLVESHASVNDVRISESERLFRWPQGRRPDDHPGLTELGL